GDNVGDVAGMGADLFESYVGAIIGAMVLGAIFPGAMGFNFVVLPLVIAAVGILVSIGGTYFVRTSEGGSPQTALNIGTFGAATVMVPAIFGISYWLVGEYGDAWWKVSMAAVAGLAA